MNNKVNFYFDKAKQWQAELEKLRVIALDSGLSETLKWGCPCYVFKDAAGKENNVVLIHAFKDYCAFLFFKGVLLKDPHGILVRQTKNVQSARQARFTNLREIMDQQSILDDCIKEAIEIERAGLKVELKKTAAFEMAAEFKARLESIPGLKPAFEALTPGRQRGYMLYFSSAKQAATRAARVEKYIPKILNGKGLDD